MKISHFMNLKQKIQFFQYSISSAKWPSNDYEMLVAEKARFEYNGKNFTYDGLVHKTLTTTDLTKMNAIKKAIASNFLKVLQ